MKHQLICFSLLLLTVIGCGKDARLTQLESQKDVKGLIALLQQDALAADAAQALGDLANKQAVEPLIAALKNAPEKKTRRSAAEALGKMKDARAVQPLIDTLSDRDQILTGKAKDALKELAAHDPKVVKLLLPAFKKDDATAKAALVSIGKPAVAPLITALKDVNGVTRINAASALGDIGDPTAIAPLVANLTDWTSSPMVGVALKKLHWQPESESNKIHFLVALGDADELRKNWQTVKNILLKDVESADYQTIQYGLYSFISIGNQDAIAALVQSLNQKGNKNMALAYLNCGEPTLEKVAKDWAENRNYKVVKTARKDVQPVKWGGL